MRRLLAFAFLLLPSFAAADVVGPEDPRVVCPLGAQRVTHHCGTVCQPLRCDSDSDCFGGRVCRRVSMCINAEPYCGRGGSLYDRVYGDCSAPCEMGECSEIGACIDPGVDAGPPRMDSGPGDVDAGSTDVDSGSGDSDSGSSATDSGPGTDSGTATDSGSSGMDSGSAGTDAGTGEADGGCGCRATSGSSKSGAPFFLVLALLAFRRRRTGAFRSRRRPRSRARVSA